MCLAGKKVLIQSNSHVSVYTGLQLAGAELHILTPPYCPEADIYLPVQADQVEDYITKNGDIDCIYLTSPNYEGVSANIGLIRERFPEKIIAVDEAHGGHFYFSSELPSTAIEEGADLSTVSVHKTLGSYSGTALVLVSKSSRVAPQTVRNVKDLFHTSSPSFFLVADVESRVNQMTREGQVILKNNIEINTYF